MDHGPWTVDRGPRTGVTGAVSLSALDFVEGMGRRAQALVRDPRTNACANIVGYEMRSFNM